MQVCNTTIQFIALVFLLSEPSSKHFPGTGFIAQKDWWRIGFTCSVLNFFIWIIIGTVWWKVIGLW